MDATISVIFMKKSEGPVTLYCYALQNIFVWQWKRYVTGL